jgi:soluble lytic murein transglycosylase
MVGMGRLIPVGATTAVRHERTHRMFRILLITLLLTTFTVAAQGAPLFPLPDQQLEAAADRLRQKDYQGALKLAQQGKESGARDLISGEAAFRLERYEEAIPSLSTAVTRFPLLADYVLLRKAQSLVRLERHEEALATARALIREYPDSILIREALFLAADSQFRLGQMPAARDAFRGFVEKYPSGNDSLKASYLAALALVRANEPVRGAAELRTLWLNNPASSVAADVDKALRELPPDTLPPLTQEELYKRTLALYDAKAYNDAVVQLEALTKGETSPEFGARVCLKLGQAQFRLRRYGDAEQTLSRIDGTLLKKEHQEELAYWRTRSLEKIGKNGDATAAYLRLAGDMPDSPYADNALYEAATTLKSQGKTAEAGQLFAQLVRNYPDSAFKPRATWEAGWERLAAADPKGAVEHFQKLLNAEETAEQGLYWLARALETAGELERAQECRWRLLREYPYGYYAQVALRSNAAPPLPAIVPLDLATELPIPPGMERTKAFITLGMAPEARKELLRLKGKGPGKVRTDRAMARLYLELGDYAAAMRLFQKSGSKGNAETGSTWSITHPVPFRGEVTRHAAQSRLSQELVYAVMRAESSFSPTITSPAGAIGLMQLMPATAKAMKPRSSLKAVTGRLTIPDYNISLGTRHLRDLLNQYEGDEVLAIAAYNAGASNVNRWVKSFGLKDRDAFIEQIPFGETRNYVKKVLSGAAIYRGLYGKGVFTPPSAAPPAAPPAPLPADDPDEQEEAHPTMPSGTTRVSQS